MIIQSRLDGSWRLFTQHDHAIVSGECARYLINPKADDTLWHLAEMAITLHDLAWLDADDWRHTPPSWDTTTSLPHDFLTLPTDLKATIYQKGIEHAASLHPYIGLLLSVHYGAFFNQAHSFYRQENHRQAQLTSDLQSLWFDVDLAKSMQHHYDWLKFMDVISLYMCVHAPGVDPATCPSWLTNTYTHQDQSYTFGFLDPNTFFIDPFIFQQPIHSKIPYKHWHMMPSGPEEAMNQWGQTPTEIWPIMVGPKP